MSYTKNFGPGYAGDIDGDKLDKALAYFYGAGAVSWQNGITALAGGARTGSPLVTEMLTQVDTVASANDSIQLQAALPGSIFIVNNNAAANAMQVFANGSDTINGTAGATGVTHAAGKVGLYACFKKGAWYRLLSA